MATSFLDQAATVTTKVAAPTVPTGGSLLTGVTGPFVWVAAALGAIALAGTMFAPLVIAFLAAAIWWQFLHAKKG